MTSTYPVPLARREIHVPYDFEISTRLEDRAWHNFVTKAQNGRHVQATHWAHIKAKSGWEVFRILARERGGVAAGVQVLMRPVDHLGLLGYVTHGPVMASDEPFLRAALIEELLRASRTFGLSYLVVQPPSGGESLENELLRYRFRPCPVAVAPTATMILDLSPDIEQIMGGMRRQTRQNVLRSQREGVTIRRGNYGDLNDFYDLHRSTSQRQGFTPYPVSYYEHLWQMLGAEGEVQVFISSYDGKDVSTLLVLAFGDRVYAKACGWSGEEASRRPNEAIFWAAIEWAKDAGYHYFDFEGFDRDYAVALRSGSDLPESWHHSPSFFKYGFGGEIAIYPIAYHFILNPALRFLVNRVALPLIMGNTVFNRLPPIRSLSVGLVQRLANTQRTIE